MHRNVLVFYRRRKGWIDSSKWGKVIISIQCFRILRMSLRKSIEAGEVEDSMIMNLWLIMSFSVSGRRFIRFTPIKRRFSSIGWFETVSRGRVEEEIVVNSINHRKTIISHLINLWSILLWIWILLSVSLLPWMILNRKNNLFSKYL